MKVFSALVLMWTPLASWASTVGVVTAIRGVVQVDGKRVQKDMLLNAGSVVETSEGKCALLLGQETVVHLDRGTRFLVNEYLAGQGKREPKASFDLKYGRVRALVRSTGQEKKDFQFRTRAAVMGVRGTHVLLDVPRLGAKPESLLTLEGVASVSFLNKANRAPVELRENQTLRVSQAESPAPQAPPQNLSSEQAKQIAERVAPPVSEVSTLKEVRSWIEKGAPPTGFQDFASENPFRRPPGLPPLPFDPVVDGLKRINFNVQVQTYE
jgi:hypothetical protein